MGERSGSLQEGVRHVRARWAVVFAVATAVWAGACRTGKTCTSNEECQKLAPEAYCDPYYKFCLRPNETGEQDAGEQDAGGALDAGGTVDAGADAGRPCVRRDDAGMCLPPAWRLMMMPSQHAPYPGAVVLLDGGVFVVGGEDDALNLNAEVWEWGNDTWADAGQMRFRRWAPKAVQLPSGVLLVVGGSFLGPLATVELYDPVLGEWRTPPSMNIGRAQHQATLLRDGRVLVTGVHPAAELSTADLSWRLTGPMEHARTLHTATLLADGRVLVTGGYATDLSPLASAEVFDPSDATWRSVAPMSTARASHTATRLMDGEVLVTGGYGMDGGVLASSERYDPVQNAWSSPGILAVARAQHTATLLLDGRVLVAGGNSGDRVSPGELNSVEIFTPSRGAWQPGPPLQLTRTRHSAILLPFGGVLVVGGYGSGSFQNTSWSAYSTAEVLE